MQGKLAVGGTISFAAGIITVTALAIVQAGVSQPVSPVVAPRPNKPARIDAEHLPNAIRLTPGVYSGGLPEGAAGFRELRELGVRTVISVDGIIPDVETAKRFGLSYAHLPFGYDGIPKARAVELTKAITALPGPIYIHCHHGTNRSPAAAAAACVGAGYLTPEQAVDMLKLAGTKPKYSGLYQSVEEMRPIDEERLRAISADFPEIADVPPMATAMVEIAHRFAEMKSLRLAGWRDPRPNADPADKALLLREQFTELLRTEEVKARPEAFQMLLRKSEHAGFALEKSLRATPPNTDKADNALIAIAANCSACHTQFRNKPLR